MARAKQTKRAEARRRYRQTVGQPVDETVVEGPEPSGRASAGGPAGARSNAGPNGRPSLGSSFRGAYHPAHVLEDLRALPSLLTAATPTRLPLTRTTVGIPWFLVSALLVIAGFVALLTSPTTIASGTPTASPIGSVAPGASAGPSSAATPASSVIPSAAASEPTASSAPETPAPSGAAAPAAPQGSGGIGALIFQLFSLPPGGPTLPILLVGFMATRASYLQGFLIGLLDLALVGIWLAFVPTAAPPSGTSVANILVSYAITGLPTSVLFAAAAAWYRRFLSLSSPKRAQPQRGATRSRSNSRPAARR